MERKKVSRCPVTGQTRETYVNLGRGKGVPGRGRPLRIANNMRVGPVRRTAVIA